MSNLKKLDDLKKYAKLLDSQFGIPGTKFRFGIDPLLSLIPVLGTFSGFITGLFFIFLSHSQGISGKVKVIMFRNVFIDFLIGLIPIYGNIKDFFYKANQKNMLLLEEHLLDGKHQGSGLKLFLIYLTVALLILFAIIGLYTWVIVSILNWFNSLYHL
jgi:hypothetical protein